MASGDPRTMLAADAMQHLNIGRSRLSVLIRDGSLLRVKQDSRTYVTKASVEQYRERQQRRPPAASQPWPPSRSEQRAIIQTLLLTNVITRADIAKQERDRLAAAVQRNRRYAERTA